MKTTRLSTLVKNMFLGAIAIIFVFSLNSCATKVNFLTSAVVPAARGQVRVKMDHNKNYNIQVNLLNLAEVNRLQTSKQTYVVWMVTDQEITKNIGQLKSSTSLLSKNLKASLETVSSFKPIKIFITAEDNANTQYPGTQVVLSTDRF